MQSVRVAAGVGLLAGVWLIVTSGFLVTSSREVTLILFGFVSGLASVYALERIKAWRARRAR
mgnify:CR=1 FL=1